MVRIARQRLRWLVLAPHPDDETLGAGALIAQTAKARLFAGLVYLTDGSSSHAKPSSALMHIRKREGAAALHRLTGTRARPPIHLGWKDAAPAQPGSQQFNRAARSLAALCRHRQIDALAVTALHEPHCDHEAAARLAYAVRDIVGRPLLVAEYLVWAVAPDAHTCLAMRTAPMLTGQRRHALDAHRSQLSAAHGPGFRLPLTRRRMPASDALYLRRST
jgi:LmbE family N-acetylglucosaminyl deacetylase